MKTCKKCLQSLPLDDFYTHPRMADGHLGFCKTCVKNRVREHRNSNIEKIRAYDRIRGRYEHRLEAVRVQGRRYRKERRGYGKNWARKNRHKINAELKLNRAVRSGKITKSPCTVCGDPKSEGHHPNYEKPLEVIWLCRKHHMEQHRRYHSEQSR